MSVYTGRFTQATWYVVECDGHPLPLEPSLKVRNHSPTGFAWGYCGSGPAQLALAILLRETNCLEAERLYQDFKRQVIAAFPNGDPSGWTLHSRDVQEWLEDVWLREAAERLPHAKAVTDRASE